MSTNTIKKEESKIEKSLGDKTIKPNDSSTKFNDEHTNPLFSPEVITNVM